MPFDRGPVSFRACHLPKALPQDALQRFADRTAGALETVRDEPQWGWVSARHLLERRIDEETAYSGGYLHLCLRQAQRKIPPALLRAECRMAEFAAQEESPDERVSRKQRRAIKEETVARLLPAMPPQLAGTYFVVDPNDRRLYVSALSQKQLDIFLGFFCQSIGFEPIPMTPEFVAVEMFGTDPATVPKLNFSPELPDTAAAGTLGQNFLTWLWFFQEECGGSLPESTLGTFGMAIDGPLILVAEGSGAFESVIRKGTPTLSAEAKAALVVGKKLQRARLIVARGRDEQWEVTVDADEFVFRGLRLPEGEELDPGSVFEERMTNLYLFQKLFFALFQRFLNQFSSPEQVDTFQTKAKRWVKERTAK